MEVEGDGSQAPLADHSVWKLIEAFGRLIEKGGPKVTHDVLFDRISISDRIDQIIDKLEAKNGAFRFDELFDLSLPEAELRGQLVVTLLAILELARLKVIRVLASEDEETLFIAQIEGAALQEARRAKVSSDAEAMQESEAEETDASGAEAQPESGSLSASEPLPEDEALPENDALPENEPLPEDETLPENEPPPQAEPTEEDERFPDGVVISPGEPVTAGDIIPEGDAVSEGDVIEPGEVVSTTAAAPDGAPEPDTSSPASVSPSEENNEKA